MTSKQKESDGGRVSFDLIWSNHPDKDPYVNPQTRKKAYDNQCAIRVSMALAKSGVSFTSFKGPRCEFGARGNGMVLRAQELASWLKTKPFPECPAALQFAGKNFEKNLAARKGIVFFQDYWRRNGERYPTGDHIDLWNMDRLTPSWQNFTRFSLGIGRIPSVYSDLENSRAVMFWPFA